MARLKPLIKQKVVDMIETGVSINKISRSLNLAKSTIYHYYKKIKGKKYKEPRFEVGLTEKDGEIVGIFAGDGSQYHEAKYGSYDTSIHFGIKNFDYALYVKNLFESFFNKEFSLLKVGETKLKLQMKSKSIFGYFKNFLEYNSHFKHSTVKLKTMNVPDEFAKGFLRGLFDTDGSIQVKEKENRIRVSFYTTSFNLINQVKFLLDKFGFNYSYYKNIRTNKDCKACYVVQLKQKSVFPFLELIKPFKSKGL